MTDPLKPENQPTLVAVDQEFRPPLVVADLSVCAYLGRDIDVSMFATTPNVVSMEIAETGSIGPTSVNIDVKNREVARVRLGPSAAGHLVLNLAMTIKEADEDAFKALMKNLTKASRQFEQMKHGGSEGRALSQVQMYGADTRPLSATVHEYGDFRPLRHGLAAVSIAFVAASFSANSARATTVVQQASQPVKDSIEQSVTRRVDELRAHAKEEDLSFSEASAGALVDFLRPLAHQVRRPAITLQDDGTLRAIWRSPQGEQVALRFGGNDDVQLILFILNEGGRFDRFTGVTTRDSAEERISALGGMKIVAC